MYLDFTHFDAIHWRISPIQSMQSDAISVLNYSRAKCNQTPARVSLSLVL